jgi:hypothetical protein
MHSALFNVLAGRMVGRFMQLYGFVTITSGLHCMPFNIHLFQGSGHDVNFGNPVHRSGSVCLNSFSRKISGAIAWRKCSGKHRNRNCFLFEIFSMQMGVSARRSREAVDKSTDRRAETCPQATPQGALGGSLSPFCLPLLRSSTCLTPMCIRLLP